MRYRRIPDETVRRLPMYLRGLLLLSEQGQQNVSSRNLACLVSAKASQIRKDFSYFGAFGTPGVGYDINKLIRQIRKILNLGDVRKAALVGVGNLGSAILAYPGFRMYGFDIAAAFDSDPKKVGRKISRVTIENTSNLRTLRKRKIHLAILAVPRDAAQRVADLLVKAGVKGILNFSPLRVVVPKKIKVITIDIAMELARLPYYMPAR